MVFSSLTFICVFFPVVFALYWMIPSVKWQNGLLILASLLFYGYGEPRFLLLMLGSAFFNYLCARVIGSCKRKKPVLVFNIIVNLGMLGYFKYLTMILKTVNEITKGNLNIPTVILPLGISFFTFQTMSYVIDVYRGVNKPERNFAKVLLYITFFPQLIAGPIVKYHDIEPYLYKREKKVENMAEGFRRFCYGLGKKVLISNTMAVAVDKVFSMGEINVLLAWVGAVGYMLQIYYDFSGYSDMAIGMGKMFGMTFPENFRYPYSSGSMKEFWRRWHISLSSWFKEYLYIPLGGNRKGRLRTVINKIIVFFCTGLWHGANWTFVAWGLYHGFFTMLEEYIKLPKKKILTCLGHIYALLVICIGFVLFRADTFHQALFMIKNMAGQFYETKELRDITLQLLDLQFITMLTAGVIGAMPLKEKIQSLCSKNKAMGNISEVIGYVGALILLAVCMCNLAGNSYNPFIYFRF